MFCFFFSFTTRTALYVPPLSLLKITPRISFRQTFLFFRSTRSSPFPSLKKTTHFDPGLVPMLLHDLPPRVVAVSKQDFFLQSDREDFFQPPKKILRCFDVYCPLVAPLASDDPFTAPSPSQDSDVTFFIGERPSARVSCFSFPP